MNTPDLFWAKTTSEGLPGVSVHDHCINVGCVAEAMVELLPDSIKALLPEGASTLAALHDVGKITAGFQSKCPAWKNLPGVPSFPIGETDLSVSDHSLVSQVFLQNQMSYLEGRSKIWSIAVGAHHGRPKGRNPVIAFETKKDWAEAARYDLLQKLYGEFGNLPTASPKDDLSDLWLLAGLISVADWIGSNEAWFSPDIGQPALESRMYARRALEAIGWPGGALRQTSFTTAFSEAGGPDFEPNSLQIAVADAVRNPGVVIVEGPMGCGKTEAALFAAQSLISAGGHHGIYFALPTQVTSNRIHKRIESFLRKTLAEEASLRLAHGSAWLEDNYDLRFSPSFQGFSGADGDDPGQSVQDARSWFASAKQALLAPYGVGTVDQALQAVVAVKHFFVRRFALAGKVVIIDEVHSYDIYTGTLITALIRELVSLRCSVIILSATLTAERRRELLAAAEIEEGEPSKSYPLVTFGSPGNKSLPSIAPEWTDRRPITIRAEVISPAEAVRELISRALSGQHVLWIRNTVVEAQDVFREIAGSVPEGMPVGLLHSRFPFNRRAELEDYWLERLGKNRPSEGPGSILVATQVVEQSVDIDLDFMISDLAPTDMLLQRVGRLWRHNRDVRKASEPEFWIRLPEIPEHGDSRQLCRAMGKSARVYAPYVLLRSREVWKKKTILLIPSDIREMIEATYAAPDVNEPEAWQELHSELEREKATLAANAEAATRVLGNPMLDDRMEVLTRRKGSPTKPLVVLKSVTPNQNGSVTLVALDDTRIEVSEKEWRRSSARFLHQWVVRVPLWMIPGSSSCPPWLALNGPPRATFALADGQGCCYFDDVDSTMTYDKNLGIYTNQLGKRTHSPAADDDEFDS
jgi:CRISPR-associated endonuclease/helicase Cas3